MAAEETNLTEGTSTTSSLLSTLTSAAVSGMAKMKELDEKHGIMEKAKAGMEAGIKKAGELDEKHGISVKVKEAADVAMKKAKEVDEQYGIVEKATATLKAGMEKAKEVDGKYGVSETVTAKVKEVDEKYGVSQKLKEADESFGVSETVKKTAAIVSEKVGITSYSCSKAFLGDVEVGLSLSGSVLTITPAADGEAQIIMVDSTLPVTVAETIVTIGELCVTFESTEEATKCAAALEKARPNEEEAMMAENVEM